MENKESREILKILADVLRCEIDLSADQVVIYNQRWIIPSDDRLYISLKITGSRPYAVNRKYRKGFIPNGPTSFLPALDQHLSANLQDIITLNVFSHKEQARLRRYEALLALASTYSLQQMERHSFSIGQVPVSFVDVSEGEGTDMLNRYAITFNVLHAVGRSSPVDYYDTVALKLPPVLQP